MQKHSAISSWTVAGLIRWLFRPLRPTTPMVQARLLAQLRESPLSSFLGSFCALLVLGVAMTRSDAPVFVVLVIAELVLLGARGVALHNELRRRARAEATPAAVPISAFLTFGWCALQGLTAVIIMAGTDIVLQIVCTAYGMALIGPVCARNYPAPRFAMVLVVMVDLPFAIGAALSGEPAMMAIPLMTPPFLLGAAHIIVRFHTVLLTALNAEEANMRLARHDPLTGILNRKGMDDRLSGLDGTDGRAMALMSIDLDGFKAVNDTHGHGAGDSVLVAVADRIRAATRADDLIARVGGDEFIIVLPGMAPSHVATFAGGLLDAISKAPVTVGDGTPVSIGASIGYACLPEDARTTAKLRLLADRALYDAKETGKGTCRRCAPRPVPAPMPTPLPAGVELLHPALDDEAQGLRAAWAGC